MRTRLLLTLVLFSLCLTIATSTANAQTATTTTVLTIAPSSLDRGQSALLSVTVTPATGATPTGRVGFYSGNTEFASAKLNDSGAATLALSSATIAPGTYAVTAKYFGDSTDAKSGSAAVNVTIFADTMTTLSSGSSTYELGQSATLTASVASKASGTPTGTVRFFYGNTLLGSATLNAGAASITKAIPDSYEAGTYLVTAKYSGDATFAPSSGSFDITLNGPFSITPGGAAIAPSATTQLSLSPAPGGTSTWFVNGIAGGNSSVGTISSSGLYSAPATTTPMTVKITAKSTAQPGFTAPSVPVYVIPAGVVAKTNNGQVASYTIDLPEGASVSAQFGTTTSYGLNTWSLPAPSGGGSVKLLVVGMMENTLYHIQGLITLPGGLNFTDSDDQFTTTQSIASYYVPDVAVTTNPNFTPQAGVEFLDQYARSANIFDLSGNLLWSYSGVAGAWVLDDVDPFKLLPNGHLLITESPESSWAVDGGPTPPANSINVLEVDYDNTIYRDLSLETLQANLDASAYLNNQGQKITLTDIHHDATLNPVTGHWILITNTTEFFTGLSGFPKGVTALGDVIIDVDPNNNYAVDWVWNEFDHLDITRHPMSFPDWTHTNAIVYSKDDHNILISIRHQNWVLKLDYDDAAGSGSILWHLGYQGDFTLVGGTSPQDWQYAQHGPSFTTPNTTGLFGLNLMDNGDDRVLSQGFACPVPLVTNMCYYSRAPVFTIDENAMTATVSNTYLGPGYSNWGGNAEQLPNGDIEADFTSPNGTGNSVIQETTQGSDPQVVWQMTTTNATPQYRAFRESSPYPGVTWSAEAERFQSEHATHPGKQ